MVNYAPVLMPLAANFFQVFSKNLSSCTHPFAQRTVEENLLA